MILTQDEIQRYTNKKRHTAQARELKAMGIPFKQRSDGSPVVLQDDLLSSRATTSKAPKLRL